MSLMRTLNKLPQTWGGGGGVGHRIRDLLISVCGVIGIYLGNRSLLACEAEVEGGAVGKNSTIV